MVTLWQFQYAKGRNEKWWWGGISTKPLFSFVCRDLHKYKVKLLEIDIGDFMSLVGWDSIKLITSPIIRSIYFSRHNGWRARMEKGRFAAAVC